MKLKFYTLLCVIFFLSSCSAQEKVSNTTESPRTLGEQNSAYTYIPFDPLPISTSMGDSCLRRPDCEGCTSECKKSKFDCETCDSIPYRGLLESLPDQTVRLSIAKIDASGSVKFGNFVKANVENENFRVILDYVNIDVTQRDFVLTKKPYDVEGKEGKVKTQYKYNIIRSDSTSTFKMLDVNQEFVSIPVYVGVGLRLTANVKSLKAGASLSGLGALAAEVKAGKLEGSLTVQTLGITGKSISSALPLPSEINETTIQNALVAIGSIKAQLYEGNDGVFITPRVVGIYKPFEGDISTINKIISDLAQERVKWRRPCNKAALYPCNEAKSEN